MIKIEGIPSLDLILTRRFQTGISTGHWIDDDFFESLPGDLGAGELTMLSFWAYGDSDDAAFENLSRVFSNIWEA
jgi:hypothetical protein